MTTTLIATLGATWQVIPEIVGLVLPDACPVYQHHPGQEKLKELREQCGRPDSASTQIWIITSSSQRTQNGIEKIRQWNQKLPHPLGITFFIARDTDEVTTEGELKKLQELVLRVMLKASDQGSVICSLAGGRKTMSADLQYAASIFGAEALLHIVAPEPLPDALKGDCASFWAQPISADHCEKLLPAFIGRYQRRDILDIEPPVTPQEFSLPAANEEIRSIEILECNLSQELAKREKNAGSLLSNFFDKVTEQEKRENWRNLYRLPPRNIERLRNEKITQQHHALLRSLPKAELHCHLGGLPGLDEQITIGLAIWQSLDEQTQSKLKDELNDLHEKEIWPWEWSKHYVRKYYDLRARAERAACLLTQSSRQQLEKNLHTVTKPRFALKDSEYGFSAYEQPGELTGSSVLGHSAALEPYCHAIHRYTEKENIVYLELRGSPHKYRPEDPVGWLRDFYQTLSQTNDSNRPYRFIWILDRRNPENMPGIIEQAVSAIDDRELHGFVVGLDLAGDESQCKPEELAKGFLPAFEKCLSVTIHAGEGQSAENIWQAAYHLHADRIGHGLTLKDNEELLTRFRNRNICLELCPTSNIEVIGYGKSPEGHSREEEYPIAQLWDSGIDLTINTDNPGISRTGLTQEYLKAAELWKHGLKLWDCLAIVKQGFVHAMAAAGDREAWLKENDSKIYRIAQQWLETA